MQIAYADAPACGNAARILLNPEAGETAWRILRNETGVFLGPDDPASFLAYEGDSRSIQDFRGLVNGIAYHYAVFARVADGAYGTPVTATLTPALAFEDASVDAQELVRHRLELTLTALIVAGQLKLSKPSVPVLSIPFYGQDTPLPVVTVLMSSDGSDTRALGEQLAPDEAEDGQWNEAGGWLSRVELDLAAWSLNAQERNGLRAALKAAVIANLPAFEDAGVIQVELRLRDEEDFQSLNAPLFKTLGSLTCQALSAVITRTGLIHTLTLKR